MLARPVVPGRTWFLTRRCSGRRFFLRPSRAVNHIFCYALASAAEATGTVVHGWTVMSNHIHIVATDPLGERPQFMALLDREIAKAVSAEIGRWGGFLEAGHNFQFIYKPKGYTPPNALQDAGWRFPLNLTGERLKWNQKHDPRRAG